MKKSWKKIKGFERYEVSTHGEVRSNIFVVPRELKLCQGTTGRLKVQLFNAEFKKGKWFSVHRLVLETFVPNRQNKAHVAHLDSNPLNNYLSNLIWATPQENFSHRYISGIRPDGENGNKAILTEKQVLEIRRRYTPKYGILAALGKEFGVTNGAIYCVVTRKSWKHI